MMSLGLDAELLEDAPGEAVLVREHGEEDVLDVPLGVAVLSHHLLGVLQHLLRLLCESVLSHHDVSVPLRHLAFRYLIRSPSGSARMSSVLLNRLTLVMFSTYPVCPCDGLRCLDSELANTPINPPMKAETTTKGASKMTIPRANQGENTMP